MRAARLLPVAALLLLAWGSAVAQTPGQEAPSPSPPPPRALPSREATLDRLFGLLKVAPDSQTAAAIAGAIQNQWISAASPAIRLLLSRGLRELANNDGQDAFDDFDAALDLDSSLVAAWHGRAMARALLGDPAGAERDIAETMKREPRDFDALQDLSHFAEQRGDWRGAYDAWSRAMDLDPQAAGGAERLKDLHRRAFGDQT
jgi:Tfp pilus assembly protein PilF